MGGLRITTRVIAFAKIAILARLLLPEQFGLFGIASLALVFLEKVTETGINVYLIQEKSKLEGYVDTAWLISIVRGFVISGFIFLLAPAVGLFFKSADSISLLRLIALVPFLRGFINPSIVKLQKELKFDKEFYLRFSIFTVDSVTTIILALLTKNAVSFVWGLIVGAILELIISHFLIRPKPKLVFDLSKIKKVLGRGKWVTGYGIFDYLYQNVDDAVVGKLLGISTLGIYQVAYKISSLPVSEVADVVSKVTFPVYVKISSDSSRLKKAFIKTVSISGLLMVLVGTTIFIFPGEIVLLILGPSWLSTVPILKILAAFGVIKGIVSIPLSLFLAVERQEYVTAVTFVSLLSMIILVIPLVNAFGVEGAAVSALIGSLFSLIVALYFTRKILKNE